MQTWYKANTIFLKIEKISISKETNKYVVAAANGLRWQKQAEHYGFFKTKEEAKQFLISYLQSKIKGYNEILNIYEMKLQKCKQL